MQFLNLPSLKIELIVWHFYISTTNSFFLVSPAKFPWKVRDPKWFMFYNPWPYKAFLSQSQFALLSTKVGDIVIQA